MMTTVHDGGVLEVVRAGIDTYQEPVVYMHEACPVCRSEGFETQARIKVRIGDRWIIATLNVVSGDWLRPHQAALSESAWQKLQPGAGAHASMSHPEPVSSMNRIRAKIYGERLVRQDHRFRPGQSRSAHAYAKFLSASFDGLLTVDPHLYRLGNLDEVFSIPAASVSAMPAVSDWICTHVRKPVVVGPDRESAQWAERVARSLHAPWTVLDKVRSGDREVAVSAPDLAVIRSGNPVIVDDIASSGHTLAEVIGGFAALGVDNVTCVIVHALFAEGAEKTLRDAGARHIVSTNTVPHATNDIDVVPLIISAIERLL